jgi:hypothetical protein
LCDGFDRFLQTSGQSFRAPLEIRTEAALLRAHLVSCHDIRDQGDRHPQNQDEPQAQFHGIPFVWFTIVARRMILVNKKPIPMKAAPTQMAIRTYQK